jgi:hypothetical protein
VPDNGIAVEPREAQRPTSLAARTPIAAILGNGDIAVGAIKRTLVRSVGGLASPWRLPALHPLIQGKRKTGIRVPDARKQSLRPAERWLNANKKSPGFLRGFQFEDGGRDH